MNDIDFDNSDKKPLVLVVDDTAHNLQVLGTILFQEGYEIALAENGLNALLALEELHPDLILLDVMMPEMDGYEVCKIIKENDRLKDIPVIFITAKTDIESIVKGFESGAVDYLTKPFNRKELTVRIKNHIDLKKSKEKIVQVNVQLQKLLADKGEYLGIAAHDLKNPLNSIIGFTALSIDMLSSDNSDCDDIKNKIIDNLNSVKDMAVYMFGTINKVLNTETLDLGINNLNLVACDISQIVDTAIQQNKVLADAKLISIYVNEFPNCNLIIDEDYFREIVQNLLSNAIKFSPFGKNIFINLNCVKINDNLVLKFSVKDEGPGLNANDMENVFEKFKKLSAKPTADETSTGLGLSIVKKMAELHNGRVYVESEFNNGANFIVEIPIITDDFDKIHPIEKMEFIKFDEKIRKTDNNLTENSLKNDYFLDGLNENDKIKIRAILPYLESKLVVVNTLIKSNVINDIKGFAVEIRQKGVDVGIEILGKYGEELNHQALTFDIEKLPITLNCFNIMVERFRSL